MVIVLFSISKIIFILSYFREEMLFPMSKRRTANYNLRQPLKCFDINILLRNYLFDRTKEIYTKTIKITLCLYIQTVHETNTFKKKNVIFMK